MVQITRRQFVAAAAVPLLLPSTLLAQGEPTPVGDGERLIEYQDGLPIIESTPFRHRYSGFLRVPEKSCKVKRYWAAHLFHKTRVKYMVIPCDGTIISTAIGRIPAWLPRMSATPFTKGSDMHPGLWYGPVNLVHQTYRLRSGKTTSDYYLCKREDSLQALSNPEIPTPILRMEERNNSVAVLLTSIQPPFWAVNEKWAKCFFASRQPNYEMRHSFDSYSYRTPQLGRRYFAEGNNFCQHIAAVDAYLPREFATYHAWPWIDNTRSFGLVSLVHQAVVHQESGRTVVEDYFFEPTPNTRKLT